MACKEVILSGCSGHALSLTRSLSGTSHYLSKLPEHSCHLLLNAGVTPDEEEAATPVPNVMDNSGALSSGGPDPASRGVVTMPDSESLRRSMVAENERQAAAAQPGLSGQAVPVPATSSGNSPVLAHTSQGRILRNHACLVMQG